jgi:hypothetical protein
MSKDLEKRDHCTFSTEHLTVNTDSLMHQPSWNLLIVQKPLSEFTSVGGSGRNDLPMQI